ncbi:MAG: hypothetical protein JOY82_07735 [Streptosporangiaceae bacterium]|nr:hypothetical protein [Streptosporangiaceae bacterium]
MTKFGVRATPAARDYIDKIATTMVTLFSIPRDEAVGRISQFWRGESFAEPDELLALFHQSPEHWAKRIYYGRKTWWLSEGDLAPAPYHPGKGPA